MAQAATRARRLRRLEPGVELWATPAGLEFLKVEVRTSRGRGGRKYRASYHWDERTLACARSAATLHASRSAAREQARREVADARTARATDGRAAAAPQRRRRLSVAEFTAPEGELDRWANGNLRESTRIQLAGMLRSLIRPLLGQLYLDQISEPLVKRIRGLLRTGRCEACEALQQAELVAYRKEQRPMVRFGHCSEGCGYGLSDSVVGAFTSDLGTLLSAALECQLIDVHPLQRGGDSRTFRYESKGGRRNPKRTDPADLLPVLPYAGIEAATAIAIALFQVERPQETLAHCFHDFLEPDPRAEHGVRVRPTCRVVKSISYTREKGTHLVDGCLLPLHVIPKLKTTDRMDLKQREPQLWPQVGLMVLRLWLERGRPPFASPLFRSAHGVNAGMPPKSPSDWAQTHFRTPMQFLGLPYDRDDSFYAARHLGADLLAIGPRMTPQQIGAFMGNGARTALEVYSSAVSLPHYAGKSMPEIIDLALARAGLAPLHELDYASAAAELAASRRAERARSRVARAAEAGR